MGRSDDGKVISYGSGKHHQVNVKSQSELDIGGRETCSSLWSWSKISINHDWPKELDADLLVGNGGGPQQQQSGAEGVGDAVTKQL